MRRCTNCEGLLTHCSNTRAPAHPAQLVRAPKATSKCQSKLHFLNSLKWIASLIFARSLLFLFIYGLMVKMYTRFKLFRFGQLNAELPRSASLIKTAYTRALTHKHIHTPAMAMVWWPSAYLLIPPSHALNSCRWIALERGNNVHRKITFELQNEEEN